MRAVGQQGRGPRPPRRAARDSFEQFNATELFCPRCRRAMPVRPRLFLVLPEGDRYNYHCAGCGDVLGEKLARPGPLAAARGL